jgi:hypothetical protein
LIRDVEGRLEAVFRVVKKNDEMKKKRIPERPALVHR